MDNAFTVNRNTARSETARRHYTENVVVIKVAIGREPDVFQRRREGQGQRASVKLDAGFVQQDVGGQVLVELDNAVQMEWNGDGV